MSTENENGPELDATGEATSTDATPPTDDTSIEVIDGEQDLGDKGKKALDAMKAERNAETKARKAAEAELARIRQEAELASKPVEEQELERVRQEASTEATQKANQRILRAELRAAAKGKLADPSDAGLFIDLNDFEVGEDGDVDTSALENAIDELIARKPHLAGEGRRFGGAADQGAGGKKPAPSQVTKQELANMTPEQINAARSAGRLNDLLGVSTGKG